MADFFTPENMFTLLMLIALQAVLGFDNLLYISLESKRAPEDKRRMVRTWGIGLAIILRIGLLFLLVNILPLLEDAIGHYQIGTYFSCSPSVHALIVLVGGVFIIYTAIKEIWHMLSMKAHASTEKSPKPVWKSIAMIVVMNLVFSFDSILSAIALTDHFATMTVAIVIGGILMIVMADRISRFLEKNRMYEILGLFILFLVGIMLISEGGHMAEMKFFGNEVTEMTKTTFYFVLVVLVIVDIVQGRYQKKLLKQEALLQQNTSEEPEEEAIS